jgi:hypothetical protein
MKRKLQQWEIDNYRTWYADARRHLAEHYGTDADLVAGLLAACSPRMSVKKNWKVALQIYRTWKAGGPINLTGAMRTHHPNIYRALAGETLSGDKVESFRQNLCGSDNAVTLDVWMLRWYGSDNNERLTPKRYRALAKRVRQSAAYYRMSPCEYQAVAWTAIRSDNGKSYKSFSSVAAEMSNQRLLWD